MIAEKVQTFYNTLGEVEAEVVFNKVASRIALEKVRTLGDKFTEVKREPMVETLASSLAHLQMKILELHSY